MKKYILFGLLICLAVGANAADGDAGYAGSYLQVPIGARAAAMGSAYIAISNDGAGMFYNPAGLANIKKKLFTSSYRAMKLDRQLGYAGFMFPTQNESALGFHWLYASSGSVEARNQDGDLLDYDLTMVNHAFSFSFAKRFENIFAAGFTGSYLYSGFAEMNSNSIKMDAGVMLYLSNLFSREKRDMMPIQDIQAGLVVRNLAGSFRWNNEKYFQKYAVGVYGSEKIDDLPIEVGLGGSARFLQRKLLTAIDLIKNEHQAFRCHAGADYSVNPKFAIRAGYSDKSLTGGFGYVFPLGNKALAIDYAFSSDKVDEGSEHIFSFDLLF